MRRPSFQFYPADWLGNTKLLRCSFRGRGIWTGALCLMHDSDQYGVLRWPLKDLASALGCKVADLMELVDKGVLKGSDTRLDEPLIYVPRSGRKDGDPVTLLEPQDGPIWFSSRMVRDEYVRGHRGDGSRFVDGDDAPPPAPKPAPKPQRTAALKAAPEQGSESAPKTPFGDGPSSSTSSSDQIPPKPPRGARRNPAIGLKAWLAAESEAGRKAIPSSDKVFAYADQVGLPREFLHLAWQEFRERYTQPNAKQYIDWRAHFRKAVRGNWLKLWWVAPGGEDYQLTTVGEQARRAHEPRAAA